MPLILIAILFLSSALITRADTPCGLDAPCEIEGGSYHLMAPEGWDGRAPLPALIYFHGHRSSGRAVFRSGGLKRDFVQKGWLVIAPNGAIRPRTEIRAWPARPGAGPRDDVAFTLAALDDAARRVAIDPARVHVAGFSAGGSMAWMMACYEGRRFAGFASVAGALRRPNPEACPGGPVRLLQFHGFSDLQVPFEGRGIRDWHQGDLFESFALARSANQCLSRPNATEIGERFWCRDWSSCGQGALRMCIHDGGHGLPRGWTAAARAWFEAGWN